MTITAPSPRFVAYAGDGGSGPFPVPFRFLEAADVKAQVVAADGGREPLEGLALEGVGDPEGGEATTPRAIALGETLVLWTDTALEQPADYIAADAFPAQTHEAALDRLTLIAQDLRRDLDRSYKVGLGDGAPDDDIVERVEAAAGSVLGAEETTVAARDETLTALATAFQIGTRAEAMATDIPTSWQALRTSGYAEPGDGGGALYAKAPGEPDKAGKFQSADGAWWRLAEVEVHAAMLGAFPGVDCTAQLQDWLDQGGNLFLGLAGDYTVSRAANSIVPGSEVCLFPRSDSHIRCMLGARLVLASGQSNDALVMLSFESVNNIIVDDLTLIGDRTTHVGDIGVFGHAIAIYSAHNVTLNRPKCDQAFGDGIFIANNHILYGAAGGFPTGIKVVDPQMNNNHRNGISIIAGDVEITGWRGGDNDGTEPRACIDVEPEGGRWVNVVIDGMQGRGGDLGVCALLGKTAAVGSRIVVRNVHMRDTGTAFLATLRNAGDVILFENVQSTNTTDSALRSDHYISGGASGYITWGLVGGATLPVPGETITLNGVAFTFVSGTPVGNQVQTSAAFSTVLANIAATLEASTDPLLTIATYTVLNPTTLAIRCDTLGSDGNSFTLAASAAVVSGPTLEGGGLPGALIINGIKIENANMGTAGSAIQVGNQSSRRGVLGNLRLNGVDITSPSSGYGVYIYEQQGSAGSGIAGFGVPENNYVAFSKCITNGPPLRIGSTMKLEVDYPRQPEFRRKVPSGGAASVVLSASTGFYPIYENADDIRNTFTLPAAAKCEGMLLTFYGSAFGQMIVKPFSGETIHYSTAAASKYVRSDTWGAKVALRSDGTGWIPEVILGTVTVEA